MQKHFYNRWKEQNKKLEFFALSIRETKVYKIYSICVVNFQWDFWVKKES